jgi:hypothetical protein
MPTARRYFAGAKQDETMTGAEEEPVMRRTGYMIAVSHLQLNNSFLAFLAP